MPFVDQLAQLDSAEMPLPELIKRQRSDGDFRVGGAGSVVHILFLSPAYRAINGSGNCLC